MNMESTQGTKKTINMLEAFEYMKQKARERGETRGEAQENTVGEIKGILLAYKECGISDKEIITRLMKK